MCLIRSTTRVEYPYSLSYLHKAAHGSSRPHAGWEAPSDICIMQRHCRRRQCSCETCLKHASHSKEPWADRSVTCTPQDAKMLSRICFSRLKLQRYLEGRMCFAWVAMCGAMLSASQLHACMQTQEWQCKKLCRLGAHQLTSFTKLGDSCIPAVASTMEEWSSVVKSVDTTASSVYL